MSAADLEEEWWVIVDHYGQPMGPSPRRKEPPRLYSYKYTAEVAAKRLGNKCAGVKAVLLRPGE